MRGGNKSKESKLQMENKSDGFDETQDTRKKTQLRPLDSSILRKTTPLERGRVLQTRSVCRIGTKGYLLLNEV